MSFQPSSNQALLMWKLLIMPDYQPAQSAVVPKLSVRERTALVDARLIELEKRGRSKHIIATDKAWDWAIEHFDTPISPNSQAAATVLQQIMTKLKVYLQTNKIPLVELLSPAVPTVEERIRAAYAIASNNQRNVSVRLADLRKHLSGIQRDEVDTTLKQMQLDGKLTLMRQDDPQSITSADEAAAVNIHGHKQHIVYLGG